MGEPKFLSFEQVAEIHQQAIEEFGGTLGIRDKAALESAIFHPRNIEHDADFTALMELKS